MSNSAALEALERRLTDLERKGNALIEVINDLRAEDGLPPRPPFGSGGGGDGSAVTNSIAATSIRPDTFYGKKMQTAVREYLEMRRANGSGPAKPRDILNALRQGGFQSEAKDDHVALVGLRAMLRKRTAYFHKLPNGSYGLTAWYPDARRPRTGDTEGDADEAGETQAAKATSPEEAASVKTGNAAVA